MKKYTVLILLFFGQYAIYAQKIALDTIWVKRYGWAYKDGMAGTDLMLQFVYPNGTDSIAQHIREDITKKFFETNAISPLDESCKVLLENSFGNMWIGLRIKTYLYRYSAVKIVNNKTLDYIIYHNQIVGCGDGTRSYSYCYSLLTGNRITIDSLFSKPAQSKLIGLLETRKDDKGKQRYEPIKHLNNLILLPKGLIFIFNPYEIGFGVDGEFRYTVKFSEIRQFLKPQAIGYFFE
ncbi:MULTISPECIES: RsiV family protein [Bacteroidales]|jgi:hypothetical protein|uniref:RsiV family protein n=1 Tax=Alistipes finegoldii TaxID=214856 RepID=A0AAE4LJY1_9BACT|nr:MULTISPECIES: RsiV family protein [Alistipes]MBS5475199.1 DUF3298 domain-containing protein [Alistipes sp.]MBV4325712.1 RsiV family protein [Alistipes finegoldii]MBV4350295.1 RsiV family protein [Alistipes finegoldii]MBV4370849.1 RsiV family protein [Alistipes finegoldii]MDU0259145.1 RsiV family protein [Alistipes finegoldii]